MIELVGISHKNEQQLFDIHIDGNWCGSRRTIAQCAEAIANAGIDMGLSGWTCVARFTNGHRTYYKLSPNDGPPEAPRPSLA